MIVACENCHFWEWTGYSPDGDDEGLCRRRAPRALMPTKNAKARKEKPQAYWPFTLFDDGCGEGQADPQSKREIEIDWTPTEIVDVDPEENAAQRPIVPRFEAEAKPIQRTGCTCHPGRQTSCPDPTCPWKPR